MEIKSCISSSMWFLLMAVLAQLVRGDAGDEQCSQYEARPGIGYLTHWAKIWLCAHEWGLSGRAHCYNDYKTHARCTWETDAHATSSSDQLYYTKKDRETLCVQDKASVITADGKKSHTCRYNTSRFVLGAVHIMLFKVPCVPAATTLQVAQQGKVRAPVDLTERAAYDGGHLLSWRSPYPESAIITKSLIYQLQYRRNIDDWTTANNISTTNYTIDEKSLILGYDYQARVRAQGSFGVWSNWSPLVAWKTNNDGVFELQCVIEGETTVTCTWQMKKKFIHYMSYHIWCQDRDNIEFYACCETPHLVSSVDELTEFTCSVNTTDPNSLTVELRPVQFTKNFSPSKHIKLNQPENLKVTEEDGAFKLSWSKPNIKRDFVFKTEIKIATSEDSVIHNCSDGIYELQISAEILRPSTNYQAQVRFWPIPKTEYRIQPSDWSGSAVFTTGPALSSISLATYIFIAVLVSVLFAIFYSALPVCRRRIVLWKGSIPSPIQSKVLEGITKKNPTAWPYLQTEKEATSVCVLLTSNNISKEPPVIQAEDLVKMAQSTGLNLLCTPKEEGKCKDKSGMSFIGPCMPANPELFIPVNGGYVITPETQNPSSTEIQTNEAPACTPSSDQRCMVIDKASGYFTMPCFPTG
ncbi:hypothetical protein DNTS_025208 [Danionella cerebrum]|uniref:Fibronectin type-III domain-containing protein n=1 Tax=Danionella cerebrum TaxID=2873325 RepID=A0A553Q4C7_9TELE|nr:hypothetical protein DNTS_025208 [Danionella translucida]